MVVAQVRPPAHDLLLKVPTCYYANLDTGLYVFLFARRALFIHSSRSSPPHSRKLMAARANSNARRSPGSTRFVRLGFPLGHACVAEVRFGCRQQGVAAPASSPTSTGALWLEQPRIDSRQPLRTLSLFTPTAFPVKKNGLQTLQFRDGDTWNVISSKWWLRWKAYSGYSDEDEDGGAVRVSEPDEEAAPPGRINNEDLVVAG